MSQENTKSQIEELKRQRTEISNKIRLLENQTFVIGKAKLDDIGIAIICENQSYSKKSYFWRYAILRESNNYQTGESKERNDQEIKQDLKTLIDDLNAIYQTL